MNADAPALRKTAKLYGGELAKPQPPTSCFEVFGLKASSLASVSLRHLWHFVSSLEAVYLQLFIVTVAKVVQLLNIWKNTFLQKSTVQKCSSYSLIEDC